MSFTDLFCMFSGLIAVVSALYACFGSNLLRVAIAFFFHVTSLGGVLLSLEADFLALMLFFIGIFGSTVLFVFTNMTSDTLAEEKNKKNPQDLLKTLLGVLVGVGLTSIVAWSFLTTPFIEPNITPHLGSMVGMNLLGKTLLREHTFVFELMGIFLLFLTVSAGLLLRKPLGRSMNSELKSKQNAS